MSNLAVHVSDKIRSRLSKPLESRLDKNLAMINDFGRSMYGRTYNLGIAETYMIANERSVLHSGRNVKEILSELDLKLHGAPPTWIKEHREFAERVFNEKILPHAFTFNEYLRNVIKLIWYLDTPEYYNSFQAVYYGENKGYVRIP